jgi:hypothetical protein
VALVNASGDAVHVVDGVVLTPGAAADCAAHPANPASIMTINSARTIFFKVSSPCAKYVPAFLGLLAPVVRTSFLPAYVTL